MLIHAPVVDLPVCFQAVCDQRNILPSLLCCQTGRQAGVRQGGWLISKCQGLPLTVSLPPAILQRQSYPFVLAVPWAKGLLLLLGHWLPVLTTVPEVSSHRNPWGMHLHLFLQGMFFLTLCIILWAATAKSSVNVTCTFLVNEEWSSCYRSWLCSMYLLIPLTDRHSTLCTRLSPESM